MQEYTLEIELASDTTFSTGTGVSGLIDSEIQQDELGLPTLSGRAIKGLLVTTCSEILYVLDEKQREPWNAAALKLYGKHGETLDDEGEFSISSAKVAPDLRACLASSTAGLSRQEILSSLTDIRRQTSMNEFGAPKDETLRSQRVLLRGITLYARLSFANEPSNLEKALLAASALGVKRAGLGRNRGKGKVKLQITDRSLQPETFASTEKQPNDFTDEWLSLFEKEVVG